MVCIGGVAVQQQSNIIWCIINCYSPAIIDKTLAFIFVILQYFILCLLIWIWRHFAERLSLSFFRKHCKLTALSLWFKCEAPFPGKAPEPDFDSATQSVNRAAEKMHCRGFYGAAPQHAYRCVVWCERSAVVEVVYVVCWVRVPPIEVSLIAGQTGRV